MPYIKSNLRKELDQEKIEEVTPASTGELNYVITKVCSNYLRLHGLNYRTINDIVGAMACAKQEFYRRVAVPYEQVKIKENGDIPEYIEKCLPAPPEPPPIRRIREGYKPISDRKKR